MKTTNPYINDNKWWHSIVKWAWVIVFQVILWTYCISFYWHSALTNGTHNVSGLLRYTILLQLIHIPVLSISTFLFFLQRIFYLPASRFLSFMIIINTCTKMCLVDGTNYCIKGWKPKVSKCYEIKKQIEPFGIHFSANKQRWPCTCEWEQCEFRFKK